MRDSSWAARRRTALWFVAHLLAGGIVSGMTLSAPPAAVLLLLLPFSDSLRHTAPGWPNAFHGVLGPLAGLALLALVTGTAWGAGALLGRWAPVLLGPTVYKRQIEETTREAVAELDTVLGLLREEDGADPAAPAPTLDGLEALLGRTRAAGVAVEATVEGPCATLAPVVSREAYRIVQEGLSNALRHAGPVPVRLHLQVEEGELTIRLENPVTGTAGGSPAAAARSGGGRGLRGIAERARLLGGEATAAADDGVWRLTVRLPPGGTTAR